MKEVRCIDCKIQKVCEYVDLCKKFNKEYRLKKLRYCEHYKGDKNEEPK